MCMEDVRIGRATDSKMVSAAVGTGLTQVLKKNPRRFGLLISSSSAQAMYLSNDGAITVTAGIYIPAASGVTKLHLKTDGDIVRGDIYLAAPGGAVTVGITETIFYEDGMPEKK